MPDQYTPRVVAPNAVPRAWLCGVQGRVRWPAVAVVLVLGAALPPKTARGWLWAGLLPARCLGWGDAEGADGADWACAKAPPMVSAANSITLRASNG